ncbi:MAG: NAD(+)/NADH kinase [Acidobacteriota bacterium]|nr:NAD(+)/NADH kinase [Acidobacteriota bacterium]
MSRDQIRSVAIVTKGGSREAARVAQELTEWLLRRGIELAVDARSHESQGRDDISVYDSEASYDLVVVLGGDGTLMSVARALRHKVPILGVNLGTLGFLTEINRGELYPCLVETLAGRFETVSRSLLDVYLSRPDGAALRYRALNDVVVTKSALARIIDLRVEVDQRLVARYRSDGLILSTPTGSTAYNLSAGGPIVYPSLPVIVVTPICPHTLTHRPLVVPETSRIEVKLETPDQEVYLTVDGQEGTTLERGDSVSVQSSASHAELVHISGRSFYDGLRSKLRWGS